MLRKQQTATQLKSNAAMTETLLRYAQHYSAAKVWLGDALGVTDDLIHVHVGLAIFVLTALLLRRRMRSPWPLVVVAVFAHSERGGRLRGAAGVRFLGDRRREHAFLAGGAVPARAPRPHGCQAVKPRKGTHQRNVGPMLGSPRCGAKTRSGAPCRSPAVAGKKRCRMHGGAQGSGAPKGNQNALKHGAYTKEMLEMRREIAELVRSSRGTLREIS